MESSADFVDPFDKLKGIPVVIEKILHMLDHQNLRNIQLVCKSWNEAVNNGKAWAKQLQRKKYINLMWKQIYDQQITASATLETESDCPAKKMFSKILHAVQDLKRNWSTGSARRREVALKDINFDPIDTQWYCKSLLTIDAQWIAVGSLNGEIQVINRKNLKIEKSLFGGDKLICVKLTEHYLITVTLSELKVWKKDSWLLLKTVGGFDLEYSAGHFSAAGHGLFVNVQNLLYNPSVPMHMNYRGEGESSIQFSVWRLQKPESTSEKNKVIKLLHRETYKTINFAACHTHISNNYILTQMALNVLASTKGMMEKNNFYIEVRSIVNFDIICKIDNHIGPVNIFSFVGDKISFHTTNSFNIIFKVVACVKRTVETVPFESQGMMHRCIQSNSHFAVGSMYGEKTELFDISPILKSPVGRFQTKPLCTLKDVVLRINYKHLPELDFIMDELSIVQFYQRNGKGTAKLVIIDFYKELGSCYEKIPSNRLAFCCSFCNQSGLLKRCSRCHSVSYCSVTCQRSDWCLHKLNCTKPT